MRVIETSELGAVGGGLGSPKESVLPGGMADMLRVDRWGSEAQNGGNGSGGSYVTGSGGIAGGSYPNVTCTQNFTVAQVTTTTTTTVSPGCTVVSEAPYVRCTLGMPSTTTSTTVTQGNTISCTESP
jgi:hypothetical protein